MNTRLAFAVLTTVIFTHLPAHAAQLARAAQAAAAVKAAAAGKATKAVQAEAAAKAAAAEKAAKAAQAEATTAEKAVKATPPAQKPAKADSYVGTWTGHAGHKSFVVKEDHTAVRTVGSGEETSGTWLIVDGEFRLHWDEGTGIKGKLSEDGQRIDSGRGAQWFRK